MVLFPIKDENPRTWIRFHYVTLALVVVCTLVFIGGLAGGEDFADRIGVGLGMIPSVFWGIRVLPLDLHLIDPMWTLLTYMFIHGGWMHLIGNMIFLWVFGDNVEDAMGHARFVVFYLLCGIAAVLTHAVIAPASDNATVGASGAISGVLGAYYVLHPQVRIWTLAIIFIPIPLRLPTYLVLGVWFAMDVVNALFNNVLDARIAWWAHISGFVAGAVLVRWFKLPHVRLWDTSPDGHPGIRSLTLPSERRPKRPWD